LADGKKTDEDRGNDDQASEIVDVSIIETMSRKRRRASYQERLASIEKGRQGRDKFGSRKKDRRQNHPGMSITNREKQKSKNILMLLHSRSMRSKKFSSMLAKQSRQEIGKKRQLKHSLK
jgi:protein SDA1